MGFNYYSILVDGEKRIFYTCVVLDNERDILDWALRYGFIDEKDVNVCSNVRLIPPKEVEERNKELYRVWWEEHKNDPTLSGKVPPTIGEAQLD